MDVFLALPVETYQGGNLSRYPKAEHLGNDFLRLLDCFTTDFHSRSFTGQEESQSGQ
ncbi:hypothetical protein HanRHA438_Chr10g0453591 [Helianthus annuus]|nr:hypothetical protein HanRHA438_Chr10g0453591 [Helianthus annuus]